MTTDFKRDIARTRRVVAWLRSTICPACAAHKKSGKSFCFSCYKRLPGTLKEDLYKRVGAGYEEAAESSMQHLTGETDTPHPDWSEA